MEYYPKKGSGGSKMYFLKNKKKKRIKYLNLKDKLKSNIILIEAAVRGIRN